MGCKRSRCRSLGSSQSHTDRRRGLLSLTARPSSWAHWDAAHRMRGNTHRPPGSHGRRTIIGTLPVVVLKKPEEDASADFPELLLRARTDDVSKRKTTGGEAERRQSCAWHQTGPASPFSSFPKVASPTHRAERLPAADDVGVSCLPSTPTAARSLPSTSRHTAIACSCLSVGICLCVPLRAATRAGRCAAAV